MLNEKLKPKVALQRAQRAQETMFCSIAASKKPRIDDPMVGPETYKKAAMLCGMAVIFQNLFL